MPLIEVDSDELAKLQAELTQARPHRALLDKLGANPKTRTAVLKLIKELDPNQPIPEIDAAAPVMEKLAALEAQLTEERKARTEERDAAEKRSREATIEQQIDGGRKKLRAAGWQEDGIEKVENLMRDRGLTDYEAAAALFERQQPREEPVQPGDYGGRSMPLIDEANDDHKLLVQSPKSWKQWQRKEIQKWFAERAQGRVRL